MALTVNTNIVSLNAQRNLERAQSPLATAMQRLSSALRINSAKDDAAGLAIATRMSTQIRGLSMAIRNANDGLSITQTAEGAMDEMTTALQRMYELANQASNYNTSADRSSLNQEVSQLSAEISRVVSQTRYNGEKLLAGGFSADIQVGTEVNETINVAISNMSPTNMGVATNYSTVSGLSDASLADVIAEAYNAATVAAPTLEGTTIGALTQFTLSSAKITNINAYSASTGVSSFSYGNGLVGANYTAATANVTSIDAGALVINGISIDAVSAGTTNTTLADNLVTAINNKTSQHGVTAVKTTAGAGETIALINRSGAAITATANNSVDADITTFFSAGTTSVSAGGNGAVVLTDTLGDTTATYDAAATGLSITGISSATTTLADSTVTAQTVSSASAANLSMIAFKSAMDSISSERSIIGAKQNRFESLIRNIENTRENITAARSRIMDTDFASETANMTRGMIMQQATISVLVQANTLPQQVLALLGGR
ncbi:MAG: flagellin [Deltaproteobacteria bacterium]|nr:flagellin [Deltaproteobacteria bacterium]